MPEPLGLIGVGLLGGALAARMAERGHDVLAFDADAKQHAQLRDVEMRWAPSASDVWQTCDCVLLCLPHSDVVAEVLDGARQWIREGQVVIDTTTGRPSAMSEFARQLARRGASYIEASVAGSSEQARRGKAALLIGGETRAVERQAPLLKDLADSHWHLGEVGAGSRFKLVHNLVLGLHRLVLAEGLVFAEALGFSSATTLEVLQQTPAASRVMETKGEKMAQRDFTPQARLRQHHKDVRLIQEEAAALGLALPLTHLHEQLLTLAESQGWGELDNSAILGALEVMAKKAPGST